MIAEKYRANYSHVEKDGQDERDVHDNFREHSCQDEIDRRKNQASAGGEEQQDSGVAEGSDEPRMDFQPQDSWRLTCSV